MTTTARPKHRLLPATAALAALATLLAGPAQAGSCSVPGTHATIQSAVDNAGCNPINVGSGTFAEHVEITRSVTIQGAGAFAAAGGDTVIHGGGTGRPVTVSGGGVTVTIRDVRVTGGNATAALPTTGSPLFGRLGGGILVHGGASLDLFDSRVDSNVANTGGQFGFGGGIAVFDGATLDAQTVLVDSNTGSTGSGSGAGGGIAVVDGSATIGGSTIHLNTAKGAGGAGFGFGGGLYASGYAGSGIAELIVGGSTISANAAYSVPGGTNAGIGGGLFLNDSTSSTLVSSRNLYDSNVARTSAAGAGEGQGGGIAVDLEGASTAALSLSRDVIAGNIANDAPGLGGLDFAQGGGVYLDADTALAIAATLTDVSLLDNVAKARGGQSAGQGGGIYARHVDLTEPTTGTVAVGWDGGIVSGNVAAKGHVSGDNATGQGGGIYLSTAPLVARDLQVQDNAALVDLVGGSGDGLGGGIYSFNGAGASSGRLMLVNSTVTDNVAKNEGTPDQDCTQPILERRGSQIYSNNTNTTGDPSQLDFVTLGAATSTENEAVYIDGGELTATNTIFTNHCFALACFGCDNDSGENYSLFFGLDDNADPHNGQFLVPGADSEIGDPLFDDPAGRNYHLQPGSAAIDEGINTGELLDLDGQARPHGPGFDIGSDEYYDEQPIFSDGFETGDTSMWL